MTGQEPDPENVVYLDEYPELNKRVWLRRLALSREVGNKAVIHEIFYLPDLTETPDEPA